MNKIILSQLEKSCFLRPLSGVLYVKSKKVITMKKVLFTFILLLVTSTVGAYDVRINGLYYNLVEKAKVAEVTTGDEKYAGAVEIPQTVTYEGNTYVVSMESAVFELCTGLTSVTIAAEGFTEIKPRTFYGCQALTSVTLPESIQTIGELAFYGCESLASISFPAGLTNI